jgi:hypothetical protein
MRWTDGPNVKLGAEQMEKLNAEVASILFSEMQRQSIHYWRTTTA